MPTYQYSCTDCGHFFEQFQSFSEDSLTVCPACEGRLRKVFNAVGVVFKGSGFYRTDSRTDSRSGDGAKPAAATAGSSGSSESKTSGGTSTGTSGESSGGTSGGTSGGAAKSGSSTTGAGSAA